MYNTTTYNAACISMTESQNLIIINSTFYKCRGKYSDGSGVLVSNALSGAIYANRTGNLSVFEDIRFVGNFGGLVGDLYLTTDSAINIGGEWVIYTSSGWECSINIYSLLW